jgi:hypothetical protein
MGIAVSDTDSFIQEVTEEVRRDQLFKVIRKYGWVAIALVILIVGGAAYREYSVAKERATAQTFGSEILAALGKDAHTDRVAALNTITAPDATGQALLAMLVASELGADGDAAGAVAALDAVSNDMSVEQRYRDIANLKRLMRDDAGLDAAARREGLEYLAVAGNPLRLLATEQLALLDLSEGNAEAAINRLSEILQDAELTQGLRQRASQMMIALGQDPAQVGQ